MPTKLGMMWILTGHGLADWSGEPSVVEDLLGSQSMAALTGWSLILTEIMYQISNVIVCAWKG